ncbi:MAG TPA: DEAD/DEAH box helicase [Phycicoccus sp.]|nr:DEAD/DEAH box helicase [Phycicoccus sp.]
MPKNSDPSKKQRWSAAKKAEKKAKPAKAGRGADSAPKKPHHRGQPDGPKRRVDARDGEAGGKRPRAERSPRWDDQDPRRAARPGGRPSGRGGPRVAGEGRERPSAGAKRWERDDRPARSFDRDDRPKRFERDDRPARSFDRDDRPKRFDRDDRPQRSFNRDDRPARSFDLDDRPKRFERDERPKRFDRDDRPARSFDRDDRPARSFDREDRPKRFARDDRPKRFDRDDRPARSYDRDDRPKRFERDDRPKRYERDDRPRRFERDDRPQRSFNRDDRPRREPRVADPIRRDRHEGRHLTEAPFAPQSFEEAEAERAEADTWTHYESKTKTGPAAVTEDNGFAALGVPDALVERLARDGITEPFPIQAATIPDALAGKDVLGRGRTGSGKTLAFGLPTIARLKAATDERQSKRPRALILVPTRELAMQVSDALEPLVHVTGLRHKLVAGGLSYDKQIFALAKGIDILVATPGRLVDLMDRGAVELGSVQITILDEADHMADMGFVDEMTSILDAIPDGGQRLLFSATLDRGVDTLVEKYMVDPVTHSTDDAQASVTTMSHHVLLIDPQDKKAITAEVANRDGQTIVFVRTQLGADRIARELRERGVLAAALHGGLSQAVRNRVLGAFRENKMPVLVATDVAARGIHVDDVGLVLQVDPPRDHKDYLHRSGRTARAGESGAVVTLALPHQKAMMRRLLESAGVDTEPVRVKSGDATIAATGGSAPSGTPVPDELWRPILEGGPKQRRGRVGAPQRGHGGGRPDHGGRRGRDDRGSRHTGSFDRSSDRQRPRAQWRDER